MDELTDDIDAALAPELEGTPLGVYTLAIAAGIVGAVYLWRSRRSTASTGAAHGLPVDAEGIRAARLARLNVGSNAAGGQG